MALFRYKELSNKRFAKYKFIDAEDLSHARKKLQELKITASKIVCHESFRKNFTLESKFLLFFTKDLYYLLHSNLPLYESLLTLQDKYKGQKIFPMIFDICDMIKYGKSLSSAFSEYKKVFSLVYISMIKSAEKSGSLDKSFLEISTIIEKNIKWKKQMQSTIIYPAFLLSFSLIILFGLFLFIIPSMKELFEDRTLHPLTSSVLFISNWMQSHLIHLGGIVLLVIATVITSIYNNKIKGFLQKLGSKIKVIKDLSAKIAIARFTTTLFNLLNNTVPILEALKLSKAALNHPYLEEDLEKIITKVENGERFSSAISISKHFPLMVSKMLSTGEHSGSITPVLKHISILFEEEVKSSLEKFTALLQPILLLLIGIIVGVVLLAVLIPLTDVSSLL
jgi:general secretion pathway protein F